MNAYIVEEFLQKRLRRLLGKKITVNIGPPQISKMSGIHPEVFVYVSKIKDFDGIMPDGAHTIRRSANTPKGFKGYEEERPGRITIRIVVLTGNYRLLQELNDAITPGALLALEMLPRFSLGSLPDKSVELHFEDFLSSLQKVENRLEQIEDVSFYRGEITFRMNGFIHVLLSRRGGFSSAKYRKSNPRDRIKLKATRTKTQKKKNTKAKKK